MPVVPRYIAIPLTIGYRGIIFDIVSNFSFSEFSQSDAAPELPITVEPLNPPLEASLVVQFGQEVLSRFYSL